MMMMMIDVPSSLYPYDPSKTPYSLHIYSLSLSLSLSSTTAIRNGKSLLGRLGLLTNGLSLPRRRGFRDFHWRRGAGRFVAAVVEVSFACCGINRQSQSPIILGRYG